MSSSTPEHVEAEVSAAIKLVLSLLEQASRESTVDALDPVTFNERRRLVIRRLWQVARFASQLEVPLP